MVTLAALQSLRTLSANSHQSSARSYQIVGECSRLRIAIASPNGGTLGDPMPKQGRSKAADGKRLQHKRCQPYQAKSTGLGDVARSASVKHRQTAAALVKALGSHGVNSLLKDTVAELAEKGVKKNMRSALSEPARQQQPSLQEQSTTGKALQPPTGQQQQQQQQRAAQQLQRQLQQQHMTEQPQANVMSLLTSWTVGEPSGKQSQQKQEDST